MKFQDWHNAIRISICYPVKILWGYLQWYDISSELITSEIWKFIIFTCASEQLIFNQMLNSKRFLELEITP